MLDGLNVTDIRLEKVANSNSLAFVIKDTGESIKVADFFLGDSYRIDLVRFADGTTWDRTALLNNFGVYGTAGNDSLTAVSNLASRLYGYEGNDSLTGYGGNDSLYGGAGNDVLAGGAGNDLLDGGAGSDTLYGNDGSDILDGGAGNDTLEGGAGNDSYVIRRGSGYDAISAYDTGAGRIETLVMEGLGQTDIMLEKRGNSLALIDKVSGDGALIQNYFINDNYKINSVNFADGSTWSGATLISLANGKHFPTVANPIVDQQAVEDGFFSFTLPAGTFADADPGSLSLTSRLVGGNSLPTWLSFNSSLHSFTGTPDNDQTGTLSIEVTATDVDGLSVFDTFDLLVANTNDAPVVASAIADLSAVEDAAFRFVVPADAFADVDAGDALSLSATLAGGIALPGWLVFDAATRSLSGTPDNGDVGKLSLQVTATDLAGASISDTFDLVVTNINDAPVAVGSIGDQGATEDADFSFTIPLATFVDVDAGDVLNYTATRVDGTALPAWLAFDSATRSFSGMPLNGDVGSVSILVTAMDSAGASACQQFGLTVANTNDAPVVADAIADQAATEDAPFSFTVPAGTFADADVGDTLSFTATRADGSALPAWLTFDTATRTFSGIPLNGDVGSLGLMVSATDSTGAGISSSFNVAVANTNDAPVATSPLADQSTTQSSSFLLVLPASLFADVDAGDTLTLTVAVAGAGNAALPQWLTFNPATRTLSGTPGTTGSFTLEVTATDAAGAQAVIPFTLTVKGPLNQVLTGGIGNDTLTGGDGSDILYGGQGADLLRGGAGDDTFQLSADGIWRAGFVCRNDGSPGHPGSMAMVSITGRVASWDAMDGGSGADSLIGTAGNDIIVLDDAYSPSPNGLHPRFAGIETIRAGAGDDIVDLTSSRWAYGDVTAEGEAGNDVLWTSSGNDTLRGGAGNDTLDGGSRRRGAAATARRPSRGSRLPPGAARSPH